MKNSNSVAVVEYKGTTKEIFEVGCTYKGIKVIARNGNQLTIQHLTPYIYHREGDIENKRVYLAGGEDTNFTEYIKWNYGIEICAHQKVEEEKVDEQPTTEKKEIKKAMVCQTAIKYLLMAIQSDLDSKHTLIHKAYNTLANYSDIFASVNLGGLISFLDNGASVKMVNSVINNSITVLNEEIGDCLLEMNK